MLRRARPPAFTTALGCSPPTFGASRAHMRLADGVLWWCVSASREYLSFASATFIVVGQIQPCAPMAQAHTMPPRGDAGHEDHRVLCNRFATSRRPPKRRRHLRYSNVLGAAEAIWSLASPQTRQAALDPREKRRPLAEARTRSVCLGRVSQEEQLLWSSVLADKGTPRP